MAQCSGGFVHPHVGQLLLEREHGRQHELGDGHGAGAPAAGERHVVRQRLEREPVDAGRQRVHPVHAERHNIAEVRRAPREREQNLAPDVVGRGPVRRHVHHPRARDGADDALGSVAAEVVQDGGRVGVRAHL
jgi:hypothetical protein